MNTKRFLITYLAIIGAVAVLFLIPVGVPQLHAQLYPDAGISNYPGGGWVFGHKITPYTNSAGTTVWLTAKAQPLGFFGTASTTQRTVAVATNFVAGIGDGTNMVAKFNELLAALQALGLIKTN
jgi:hypothetical protein